MFRATRIVFTLAAFVGALSTPPVAQADLVLAGPNGGVAYFSAIQTGQLELLRCAPYSLAKTREDCVRYADVVHHTPIDYSPTQVVYDPQKWITAWIEGVVAHGDANGSATLFSSADQATLKSLEDWRKIGSPSLASLQSSLNRAEASLQQLEEYIREYGMTAADAYQRTQRTTKRDAAKKILDQRMAFLALAKSIATKIASAAMAPGRTVWKEASQGTTSEFKIAYRLVNPTQEGDFDFSPMVITYEKGASLKRNDYGPYGTDSYHQTWGQCRLILTKNATPPSSISIPKDYSFRVLGFRVKETAYGGKATYLLYPNDFGEGTLECNLQENGRDWNTEFRHLRESDGIEILESN